MAYKGINIGPWYSTSDFNTEFARLASWGCGYARIILGNFTDKISKPAEDVISSRRRLVGSRYRGKLDMSSFISLLDAADANGIKVIPCLFTGGPYSNPIALTYENVYDTWAAIMSDSRIVNHPVITMWELVNEPPYDNFEQENLITDWMDYWQPRLINLIRGVSNLPIVVSCEPGLTGSWMTRTPYDASNIVYTVHHYSPWPWVNHIAPGDADTYPGNTGYSDYLDTNITWNLTNMTAHLQPLKDWADLHGVDFLVGEFSVMAASDGDTDWISDCISIFNSFGWYWFYHSDYPTEYGSGNAWQAEGARLPILQAAWGA